MMDDQTQTLDELIAQCHEAVWQAVIDGESVLCGVPNCAKLIGFTHGYPIAVWRCKCNGLSARHPNVTETPKLLKAKR